MLVFTPYVLHAGAVALATVLAASGSVPPGQWDSRGDQVLSAAGALEALDSLPADAPAAVSWGEGGSRTGWFGQAWEDVDGDGCDTRNEILSRDLTLSHLLSHRSGLPDPVQPPRGHSTECSLDRLMRRPDRHWGLAEVVAQCAGLPPQGRPGERFAYGDANYALAQCVLQEVTGLSAHEVLRTQVFQPAGMTRTGQPHSTATDEELAGLKIAPVWVKGAEISHARALSVGSADGGAVTTLEDMVRFQEALHEGDLLDRDLLARLARPRSRLRAGLHYGTGLATIRFGEFIPLVLRGLPEPVGGLGLWAVHSFFYPRQRVHVVMNLHSTTQMQRSFALHIAIARRLAHLS